MQRMNKTGKYHWAFRENTKASRAEVLCFVLVLKKI